jgi:hypothetical protein
MNEWHVADALVARYVDGTLDLAAQSSVETHVTQCEVCRVRANDLAPTPELEDIWQRVVVGVADAEVPRSLRVASRLGLPDADGVILRASSALHRPWLLSVAGALLFAILGTWFTGADQRLFYLLLAPLLPALTVTSTYDSTDPVRELAASTSYNKLRIALLRTVAAVSVALPLVLVVGLILPGIGMQAFAWLLPSLALTLLALNLLTWLNASTTAGVITILWLCFVLSLRAGGAVSAAASPGVQLAFTAAALVAAAVLALRLTSHHAPGGYS